MSLSVRPALPPTIARARATLNRAESELRLAVKKNDDEGARQAAEKGWRAAREAVYTVLIEGGITPTGTLDGGDIRGFEESNFFGYNLSITDGYDTSMRMLHGKCFYDGSYGAEDSQAIELALKRVKKLIGDCDTALSILRDARGYKRKRR